MKFQVIALVIITLAIIFVVSEAANSQSRNCGNRDSMVEMLHKSHGEAAVIVAHNNGNQSMLEFFGRSDGTTWTILITYKNELTCAVALGDWWMFPKGGNITKPINIK